MKSGAELMVGGCLPDTDHASLKRVFVGKTIRYTDLGALDALPGIETRSATLPPVYGASATCAPLEASTLSNPDTLRFRLIGLLLPLLRPMPQMGAIAARLRTQVRMTISVQAGCSRECPYCAKRFARGPVRSKPVEAILRRISEATQLGFRSFELLADSIGDYGKDLGTDLGTLFDRLAAFDGPISFGIQDLHPEDFLRTFDRIVGLCKTGKLHSLYVITESGNQRVLESMRRGIDTFDLIKKLRAIREYRTVFMQSAIIVGYPGETEQEFGDTIALLHQVNFDDVFVHCYCDMPNTESSRRAGKISREEMAQRLQRVRAAGIKHKVSEAWREWQHSF
jgi:tRNA A37 methylthiotransferase MiaB